MVQKTCIITGANSGIGKAAAIQIASKGYRVIMACRNRERGEAALADVQSQSGSEAIELMIVDMSSQSSIRAFAEEFNAKYDTLDVLIHNAAAFDIRATTCQMSQDGIESIWATNHLGPVYLTDRLLGAVENPHVDCVAHPTGRLVNRRDAYDVDMDAVMAFAQEHSLTVIEDAAQAHGARWHGSSVGSFGRLATWSLPKMLET